MRGGGHANSEMVNGKPHDHPINDILDHNIPVYSPKADDLVRQIAQFVPRYRLWELFDWFAPPPLAEFERQLAVQLDELRRDAKERGWEVPE